MAAASPLDGPCRSHSDAWVGCMVWSTTASSSVWSVEVHLVRRRTANPWMTWAAYEEFHQCGRYRCGRPQSGSRAGNETGLVRPGARLQRTAYGRLKTRCG